MKLKVRVTPVTHEYQSLSPVGPCIYLAFFLGGFFCMHVIGCGNPFLSDPKRRRCPCSPVKGEDQEMSGSVVFAAQWSTGGSVVGGPHNFTANRSYYSLHLLVNSGGKSI